MRKLMVATLASGLVLAGCATSPTSGQQQPNKAAIGAASGAALGAAISKATGGSRTGRDAAIGAALGAGVGYYMQRQEEQLRQQTAGTGIEVQRNPQTHDIDLVIPDNITFAVDSDRINPSFRNTLDQLASTLSQFHETTVVVKGHTDSTGRASYNQGLSERRAASVANYLAQRGVSRQRMQVIGYGQTQPIASNSTEYGRQQNRRVEITINAPRNVR